MENAFAVLVMQFLPFCGPFRHNPKGNHSNGKTRPLKSDSAGSRLS
jgi:hypothetical protein